MKASKLIFILIKMILKHGNLQIEDYNGWMIKEVNYLPDSFSNEGIFNLKSELNE